jgi:hypothetical protein
MPARTVLVYEPGYQLFSGPVLAFDYDRVIVSRMSEDGPPRRLRPLTLPYQPSSYYLIRLIPRMEGGPSFFIE